MLKLMIGVVIATVIVIFAFSVINSNMSANPQGQSSMHVIDDNFYQ